MSEENKKEQDEKIENEEVETPEENTDEKSESSEGDTTPSSQSHDTSASHGKRNTVLAVIVAIIIIVIAGGAVMAKTGVFGSLFSSHKAVAIVNGEKITQGQLAERFAPLQKEIDDAPIASTTKRAEITKQTKDQLLDNMVNEKLLKTEAKNAGVSVTDDEVQTQYDNAKQMYTTQQAQLPGAGATSTGTGTDMAPVATTSFEDYIQENGYSVAAFRDQIRTQTLISKYLAKKLDLEAITVTDDEAKTLYDTYIDSLDDDATDTPSYEDMEAMLKDKLHQDKAQQKVQTYVQKIRGEADVKILI